MNAKLKWLLINLAVAAAIFISCFLTHHYLVRPTLSVTIWPAAGLGVAFIMVWGARIIPGIALAELINSLVLYQVLEDFGWNRMAMYDALLYVTSVLRPVLAGFLARSVVGESPQLIHFKTIGKFFLYATVIPCLLTTLIFVSLLVGAGHYGSDDYLTKGLLWYLGDLMSVLVYTPVVMSFIARPRSIWRPRMASVGLPVMVGFLMVFMLFNSFKSYEENKVNEIIRAHLNFIESITEQQQFNANQLVEFIQNNEQKFKLGRYKLVLSEETDAGDRLVYENTDTLTTRFQNHIHHSQLNLAGLPHQLTMTPTNQYFSEGSSFGLWLTLFIALSFTGFVGIGMLVLTGRHALTANEVERRTLQLKLVNQRLHESNQNYQRIIEKQPVIFWKVDLRLDKVTYVSQEAEHILGYAVDQWLTEPHFFSKRIHPDDLSMVKNNMLQDHLQEKHVEMEYRVRHADGDYRWFRDVLYIPDDFERSNEVMGMLIDITDKKSDAEKIHHLAFHDALTELPNRQNFQNELNELIERAKTTGQYGAVLFLDMDRFKVLNDALGHHFGDQLLLKIAKRLRDFDDEFTVMARFGGDEFVLATDCEYNNANDAAVQIIMLAERITQHLAEPYRINDSQHICTVSMGITIYPTKNATVNDIIRQADVAMYRSKEQGRNKVTMYHESMKKENDKMLYVEQVLRNAVSHDSFILKYQPIVNAERQVVAFESLIRIFNEQQTIFPDEFIPVAEDTDLIQPVGRWVISHACLKINDCGHSISVNVSSKQFHQQGFIMYIDQILQRFEVGAGKLTIELTEGVVVGNLNEIKYKFQRLKDMGVLIAIDDFGTGYSSLEYLRQLPIDYLKIDKSFVSDLTASESSQVIIETIISMAKHLGLQTVAEGVETEAQFAILKAQGCDYFQGYLFGKPGDLMAIE